MIDKKEALKNEGGGGKQSQKVQNTDNDKSLYWVAIALAVFLAAGVLVALFFTYLR